MEITLFVLLLTVELSLNASVDVPETFNPRLYAMNIQRYFVVCQSKFHSTNRSATF